MSKNILFVCKHNLFRSRVAEIIFKKLNQNKEYVASSAGLISWKKKDLRRDKGFLAENIVGKRFGINLKVKSKAINSSILKKTDLLVIVADDVPKAIFEHEKSFTGKVIVWKIRDVKSKDKDKEKVATKTIKFIYEKVKHFVETL